MFWLSIKIFLLHTQSHTSTPMEQSDLGPHLLATEASEIKQKMAKQIILVVKGNWVSCFFVVC